MSDITAGILRAVIGVALLLVMFWYDKKIFHPVTKKNGKISKPFHKRWWTWTIIVALIVGGIGGAIDNDGSGYEDDDDYDDSTEQVKKVNPSQNMPGQKINKSLANKGKNYWTSKDDKKLRLFVYGGKITAIKYVLNPDLHTTVYCQGILEDEILHDKNLKYTDDKTDSDDTVLDNDKEYNIYSPKNKKWYRVVFDPAEKDLVTTFSVYPGKSADAE